MADSQYADIPELAAQEEAIKRRQAIAQAMMAQGLAPIESGIEARTRTPVPVQWSQGLQKLAEAYFGKKDAEKAAKELTGLATKKSEGEAAAVSDYQRTRGGVVADPGMSLPYAKPGGGTEQIGTDTLMAQPADPRKAITDLLASPYAPQGVKALALQENAPYNLSPGEVRKQNGQTIAEGLPPKASAAGLQKTDSGLVFDPASGQYRDSSGKILTSEEVATRERALAASKAGATAAARVGDVNSGVTDAQVEYFLQNNKEPTGLSRNPVAQNRFWQAVHERAVATGQSIAAQTAQSRLRGSIKPAMEQTQKQLAANSGFLGTLHKNIAAADAFAQRVGGDSSPKMNEIFNNWKRHVTGDPDVAALDFWNNSIQGEAAKIASGGVGSVSAASDTQIQHQRESMNTAQNYAQWRASADAMLQEGDNRLQSIKESLDQLMQSSSTAAPGPAAPVPVKLPQVDANGWRLHTDKNGKSAYVSPDGKQFKETP